jgi:hypothetical protein
MMYLAGGVCIAAVFALVGIESFNRLSTAECKSIILRDAIHISIGKYLFLEVHQLVKPEKFVRVIYPLESAKFSACMTAKNCKQLILLLDVQVFEA